MKILFKYPTRQRPEWFKKTLQTYIDMLSEKHYCTFFITIDDDDETMNNDEMKKFIIKPHNNIGYRVGNHKTKIDACNADLGGQDFDILFLISDDMIPVVKGFDNIIASNMESYFPDLDGALFFNDGFLGKDKTITLSILGKKLYDHFGYIYHPDYKSFFCDTEFTEEVYRMKKVVYFDQVIVKHEWHGGPNSDDALYRHNSKLGVGDKAVYAKRKKLNFPKESVL